MGRKSTKLPELSKGDKKYIDLLLKTSNNVNYDELFVKLSAELDKPEQLIRDYADGKVYPVEPSLLPEAPPVTKPITATQKHIRDQFTPARQSMDGDVKNNKARHVTIYTDNLSETLKNTPAPAVKGPTRYAGSVFRQPEQ